MSISYEGIGHFAVTCPAEDCAEGAICKIDSSGYAAACSAGDRFCGLVQAVEGNNAAVIMGGFVTVSYTGSEPACGWGNFSADGNGGVKTDSAGMAYLVVEVDPDAQTLVMKL